MISKHLEFTLIEGRTIDSTRKVEAIGVYIKKNGNFLGLIEWFAGYKQYAFCPEKMPIFTAEYLSDIQAYIKKLEEERK